MWFGPALDGTSRHLFSPWVWIHWESFRSSSSVHATLFTCIFADPLLFFGAIGLLTMFACRQKKLIQVFKAWSRSSKSFCLALYSFFFFYLPSFVVCFFFFCLALYSFRWVTSFIMLFGEEPNSLLCVKRLGLLVHGLSLYTLLI